MQMEKKQFVVIFFTILAFLFLGYQVFRLVTDDIDIKIETKSDPVNTVQSSNNSNVFSANRVQKQTSDPAPASASVPARTVSTDQLIQKKDAGIAVPNHQSSEYKKTYIQLINLYELAKMKRQLLEEEAAIAEAQQRIAEINKSTKQLNRVGNLPETSEAPSSSYQLSYIDKQNGQWSAVLKKDGVYQTVTVGSLLPDHYEVTSINEKGVILQNAKQQVMVTFNGMMALAGNQINPSTKKALTLKMPKKKIHYSWHSEPLLNIPTS